MTQRLGLEFSRAVGTQIMVMLDAAGRSQDPEAIVYMLQRVQQMLPHANRAVAALTNEPSLDDIKPRGMVNPLGNVTSVGADLGGTGPLRETLWVQLVREFMPVLLAQFRKATEPAGPPMMTPDELAKTIDDLPRPPTAQDVLDDGELALVDCAGDAAASAIRAQEVWELGFPGEPSTAADV